MIEKVQLKGGICEPSSDIPKLYDMPSNNKLGVPAFVKYRVLIQ